MKNLIYSLRAKHLRRCGAKLQGLVVSQPVAVTCILAIFYPIQINTSQLDMAKSKKFLHSPLQRQSNEVKRYRTLFRVVPVVVLILIVLLSTTYLITTLYNKFGAFTVMVNKYDNLDYGLTLSPSTDFKKTAARLNCHAEEYITNISGDSIPAWVDNVDGEHNGENYVACTFYCKNVGEKTLDYTYELYITNMTKDIEKAIRVRLYVNGSHVTYAYPRTDGYEGAEPGTIKFYSGETIAFDTVQEFYPNQITKFTVVIWLEGDDPDCIDAIIGGEFKVDMQISAVSAYDQTSEK